MKMKTITYCREEIHLELDRIPVSASAEQHFKCQKTLGKKD